MLDTSTGCWDRLDILFEERWGVRYIYQNMDNTVLFELSKFVRTSIESKAVCTIKTIQQGRKVPLSTAGLAER